MLEFVLKKGGAILDGKNVRYQPQRFSASQIKILYTPIEYIEAGEEIVNEIVKKADIKLNEKKEFSLKK